MSSVWVKVYVGENDSKARVSGIHNFTGNCIDQLKEKIKEKEQLACPASQLVVYPPQEDEQSLPWNNGIDPLDARQSLNEGLIDNETIFVVLAPEFGPKQVVSGTLKHKNRNVSSEIIHFTSREIVGGNEQDSNFCFVCGTRIGQ